MWVTLKWSDDVQCIRSAVFHYRFQTRQIATFQKALFVYQVSALLSTVSLNFLDLKSTYESQQSLLWIFRIFDIILSNHNFSVMVYRFKLRQIETVWI